MKCLNFLPGLFRGKYLIFNCTTSQSQLSVGSSALKRPSMGSNYTIEYQKVPYCVC